MEKLKEIIEKYPRIGIAGLPGCGKTYAAAVLANLINKKTYVFDTTGAFTQKKLFNGLYVKIPRNYQKGFRPLLEKTLKDSHKFIVLNTCDILMNERPNVINEFAAWANAKERIEIAVVVDEIAAYMREGKAFYSWEFDLTVREKRNAGIFPIIMITQRPAEVAKAIFGCAGVFIFFQLSHDLDRKAFQRIIGLKDEAFQPIEEELKSLQQQEALIYRDNRTEKFTFPKVVVR